MIQYLIVCPLVFLAGFIDAIAGGGGLISLPAYMLSGIPVHYAIGTNKLSSGMGTAIATVQFAKNGYIKIKLGICSAICALVGSSIGAIIALKLSDGIFKILMLGILPITAFYVLRNKDFGVDNSKITLSEFKIILLSMGIAFVVGIYDGFYGPGTGTFLLLLLTGLANLDLHTAAGTTKVINLTTNIAALTVYLLNGKVLILMGLVAGGFSIAGNYIGTRYFAQKGSKIARPIIIVVLLMFFIKIITEML